VKRSFKRKAPSSRLNVKETSHGEKKSARKGKEGDFRAFSRTSLQPETALAASRATDACDALSVVRVRGDEPREALRVLGVCFRRKYSQTLAFCQYKEQIPPGTTAASGATGSSFANG